MFIAILPACISVHNLHALEAKRGPLGGQELSVTPVLWGLMPSVEGTACKASRHLKVLQTRKKERMVLG